MKRVVITGVAGFIGSNLARTLLSRGYSVAGIDNLEYGLAEQIPECVDFYRLDIRDRAIFPVIAGADAVFHLAAKNCLADCQDDPIQTSDINVTGTVNVFEAVRKGEAKKIIYAESSALYEGVSIFPTSESKISPRSFYSTSKAAAMAFAKAYERFYGVRATALRYFCVYGPRQDYRRTIPPVMSSFIIRLLRGCSPVIYGDGQKRRDFIYIDDVNDFHLIALEDARTDGKTFNLGSGINYSVTEIYNVIAELLNSSVAPCYLPELPGEAQQTLADISAAKALGWRPKVDLRAGIAHSIGFIKGLPEEVRLMTADGPGPHTS